MVKTRFAPSPTSPIIGYLKNGNISQKNNGGEPIAAGLHAGGLRTALYNYVYAKKHGGLFILRCEDTSVERSNDACLKSMLRDFEWAGLKFDAGLRLDGDKIVEFNNTKIDFGPFRQSQRKHIYNKYIDVLLGNGMAYEKDGAIFFRMPKEPTSFKDEILGQLELPADKCEDFVLRKASGMPSFYMAMTVDDQEMGITHVMRAQEHISTCYRQIALQKALKFNTPVFGHIPLIMNIDGTKMSKRQARGEINAEDFRQNGYIAGALNNYLACLGWGFGNNTEIFSIDQMIEKFDIKDIGKANARFDYKKLLNVNAIYLKNMSLEEFSRELLGYGQTFWADLTRQIIEGGKWPTFIKLYHKRVKTLKECFENCKFLLDDPQAQQNQVLDEAKNHLEYVSKALSDLQLWQQEHILSCINNCSTSTKIPMGQYAQALRLAITGSKVSPPIDITLEAVGKQTSINRIRKVLQTV